MSAGLGSQTTHTRLVRRRAAALSPFGDERGKQIDNDLATQGALPARRDCTRVGFLVHCHNYELGSRESAAGR